MMIAEYTYGHELMLTLCLLVLSVAVAQDHRASQGSGQGKLTRLADGFPWSSTFDSRLDDILEELRSDMTLDVSQSVLPTAMIGGGGRSGGEYLHGALQYRNKEGFDLLATPVDPPGKDDEGTAYLPEQLDLDKLNMRLNMCSIMPANWWNYEWCHHQSVTQFHLQEKKTPPRDETSHARQGGPSAAPRVERDPVLLLGTYERTLVQRQDADPTNTSSPIVRVVDHYTGGQRCDETDSPRQTEVA